MPNITFARVLGSMILVPMCITGVAETGTANSQQASIQVLYTGRLMGYFRIPDLQSGTAADDCNSIPAERWSTEAQQFETARRKAPGAVLLGTGDNFAPRFEARVFDPKPTPLRTTPVLKFEPAGKDQYAWYPGLPQTDTINGTQVPANRWIHIDDVAHMRNFQRTLRRGQGTIPADNVGCFLLREGYSAIVPGKHDFYFGPERVRQLERFLASNQKGTSVKMLGANLVIETTWKGDHKPLPDTERRWNFSPHWPSKFRPPSSLPIPALITPGDEGKVYPWLPAAIIKLMDLPPTSPLYRLIHNKTSGLRVTGQDFEAYLGDLPPDPAYKSELTSLLATINQFDSNNDQVYLCKSNKGGDPDDIPLPGSPGCSKKPLDRFVWLDNNSVDYLLEFPSPLKPGENYGLCVTGNNLPAIENGRDLHFFCKRFSVYRPLFTFTSVEPLDTPVQPYALVSADPEKTRSVDTVIFGAVDPDVPEYVGTLNLQWENRSTDDKETSYKTVTAAEDPAEALREATLAFDWMYQSQNGRRFGGIRILLAQMSPQKARLLAKRMKRFDIVVTAADHEQAIGTGKSVTDWNPEDLEETFPRKYPAYAAVPDSYYVETRTPKERVQINSLSISASSDLGGDWQFESKVLRSQELPLRTNSQAPKFWTAVSAALARNCLPTQALAITATSVKHEEENIRVLTLCAIQKEVGADVVLLQKRDLFIDLPTTAGDIDAGPDRLQQILDRIIWKGDFLTLLSIPGSALTQVMQQSKKYKADDASALSLSDEQNRELVSIGMQYDPDRAEYLINGEPLDKNRLYSVATSDYVAAGDTGYADLGTAAVQPPHLPSDFPKLLDMISAVVCRSIAAQTSGSDCQPQIKRDEYFDALELKPTDTRAGQTAARQLYSWTPLDVAKKVPGEKPARTATNEVEKSVQERGIAALHINPPSPSLLALDNASVSLTSVNHKFSDAELRRLFPGSPVTQLTTTRSHTIQFDIKPKYTYSWDHFELFEGQELRYTAQYTGQANASRILNQKENLWSSDTGALWQVPSRRLPHLEPLLTFHSETQLWNPLPNFIESLASSGKPPVVMPFDQSRTYLLLPRVGMRFKDRTSWIEAGIESGGELNAVRLVQAPNGIQTLVKRPNIRVRGVYWNWHTIVPFHPNVSWQIDEDGDFFFNSRDDNPIDTRFRSDTETAVNFKVWPSLSFSPTYELFLYSNKVQGIWFWQGQAAVKMKFRFDFWNHREWTREIQYIPPK